MQRTGRLGEVPEPRHRRAVLLLVLLGVLTMHGFLAFTAPAPVAASTAAHGAAHGSHDPAGTADPAEAGSTLGAGGGAGHDPAEHSGVLAGCVLALVGVGITVLLTARGGRDAPTLLARLRGPQARAAVPATAHHPTFDPHRLCVMRV